MPLQAAPSGMIGYGTVVKYSVNLGVAYTALAVVEKIKPPKMASKDVDVTHLLSPSGFLEFIQGLVDAGQIDMTVQFIGGAAVWNALYAIFSVRASNKNLYWEIILPDIITPITGNGTTLTCQGYIKDFDFEPIEKDNKLLYPLSIKVSGVPVITVAT